MIAFSSISTLRLIRNAWNAGKISGQSGDLNPFAQSYVSPFDAINPNLRLSKSVSTVIKDSGLLIGFLKNIVVSTARLPLSEPEGQLQERPYRKREPLNGYFVIILWRVTLSGLLSAKAALWLGRKSKALISITKKHFGYVGCVDRVMFGGTSQTPRTLLTELLLKTNKFPHRSELINGPT